MVLYYLLSLLSVYYLQGKIFGHLVLTVLPETPRYVLKV